MKNLFKKLFYKQRARKVADFYDHWSEKFLTITDTFQGFRTENVEDIHKHTIEAAALSKGDVILDAGCGVGGPAFYFTRNLSAQIYALTNSKEQIRIINSRKGRDGIRNINAVLGDYHELSKYFEPDFFSHVLFLESLGHSYNPQKVLKETYLVLKKGGVLYIRDGFKIKTDSPGISSEIDRLAKRANEVFVYNHLPADLYIGMLQTIGFSVEFSRVPNVVFKGIDEQFEKKLGIPSTRGSVAFAETIEIKAVKI